jgi:alpha-N-arabinofuranosidase
MKLHIDPRRILGKRDPMIYGHFIEHFHRQIYGGIFDPGNPLSDKDGFREDVIEAMKKIKVPILRWPGGCFVSAYHWKDAVGPKRTPYFDKAWRVEDPSTFGTDEYIAFCRKVGCEPYICTNAGTGTAEEMSDWVEYCNLKNEGQWAKQRIANGHPEPYNVKYWSLGNENYGGWEMGAKSSVEWGRLMTESAKMMKRVDPRIELSAAALAAMEWNSGLPSTTGDHLDWNISFLRGTGERLSWLSIHNYFGNQDTDYEAHMARTAGLQDPVDKVRGLLTAMGLEKSIRIAYDEWNPRGWYHPNVGTGLTPEDYIKPRDLSDNNSRYTMSDAVFTACFLNMANRNCDIVGMTNYSPIINTRGCIFTHKDGIVLRSTYHVFDLYVNELGDTVLDTFADAMPRLEVRNKVEKTESIDALDVAVTVDTTGSEKNVVIAAVNKDPVNAHNLELDFQGTATPYRYIIHTLAGSGTESYNDIGRNDAVPDAPVNSAWSSGTAISLPPHSINVIRFI